MRTKLVILTYPTLIGLLLLLNSGFSYLKGRALGLSEVEALTHQITLIQFFSSWKFWVLFCVFWFMLWRIFKKFLQMKLSIIIARTLSRSSELDRIFYLFSFVITVSLIVNLESHRSVIKWSKGSFIYDPTSILTFYLTCVAIAIFFDVKAKANTTNPDEVSGGLDKLLSNRMNILTLIATWLICAKVSSLLFHVEEYTWPEASAINLSADIRYNEIVSYNTFSAPISFSLLGGKVNLIVNKTDAPTEEILRILSGRQKIQLGYFSIDNVPVKYIQNFDLRDQVEIVDSLNLNGVLLVRHSLGKHLIGAERISEEHLAALNMVGARKFFSENASRHIPDELDIPYEMDWRLGVAKAILSKKKIVWIDWMEYWENGFGAIEGVSIDLHQRVLSTLLRNRTSIIITDNEANIPLTAHRVVILGREGVSMYDCELPNIKPMMEDEPLSLCS